MVRVSQEKQAGRAIQDKGISESRNTEAEEAARVAQETSFLIRLPSANQRVVDQLDRLIGGKSQKAWCAKGAGLSASGRSRPWELKAGYDLVRQSFLQTTVLILQ